MPKQHIKLGKRPAPRPKQTLEVSDGVRVVMAGLAQNERGAVEAAIESPTTVRRLPVEYVASTTEGDMYAARVTPRLRLIYRLAPYRIEVTDLLNADAVAYLLRPALATKKPQPKRHAVRLPKEFTRSRNRSARKPTAEPAAQLTTNT
jgi:hypothetical protein